VGINFANGFDPFAGTPGVFLNRHGFREQRNSLAEIIPLRAEFTAEAGWCLGFRRALPVRECCQYKTPQARGTVSPSASFSSPQSPVIVVVVEGYLV
jgi:hypothetical protein